jgi:hypothetical protein
MVRRALQYHGGKKMSTPEQQEMSSPLRALFGTCRVLRSPGRWHAVVGTLAAALVILSAGLAGCEDEQDNGPGVNQPVLTEAEAAQEAGLTAYWLGPSFEAGGVLFRISEAYFPEGIAGVPLRGLKIGYSSQPEPAGSLYLYVFSRSDRHQVEEKVLKPPVTGVTRKEVTVDGREGELLYLPLDTRPLNQLWLSLDLGDAVVVAVVLSAGPVEEGGPDHNPIINDPDLLIQVMQNLRPYPE